jgi:hypothetical protein
VSGELNMKLQIDTGSAVADIGKAAKAAQGFGDDLDDTRTAGQKVADALKAATDTIVASLKEDADAADALARAIGPELMATADGGIGPLVQRLKGLGLTSQDIKADAEALADAFKHSSTAVADLQKVDTELGDIEADAKQAKTAVDGIGTANVGAASTGAHGLGDEMHRVGKETDQSKSVMANFTGNALSSLPGVSGAFGPLNQAIGQFGEYAAEGNIKLGSLAKLAGPMLGVSAAMMLIDNEMGKIAEVDAFHKDQVEGFTKAILAGEDAARALADRLREAGGIKLESQNMSPFSDAMNDITSTVAKAGLSVDQYSQLVIGGEPAIKAWVEAQRAAGNTSGSTLDVVRSLSGAHKDYVDAQEAATVSAKFFKVAVVEVEKGTLASTIATDRSAQAAYQQAQANDAATAAIAKTAAAHDDLVEQMDLEATAADSLHDELEANVQALEDDLDAHQALIDAQRAAADSTFALHKATADYNGAEKELSDSIKEAKGDQDKINVALDDHTQKALAVADATGEVYKKTIEASGGTETATQKIDIFNQSLLDQATSKVPGANDAIADYIIKTNDIPAEKATAIKAAIAAGDLAEAKRLIDEASATRTASLVVDADDASIAEANRRIQQGIDHNIKLTPVTGAHARGGRILAGEGVSLVGEEGPELVSLPAGSMVHTANETASMVGSATGIGGHTFNVTINAGMGTNGTEVGRQFVDYVRQYERVSGKVFSN